MAMRIRANGTMWCAAHTEPQPNDTYVDDVLHHEMIVHGAIVSYPMPRHETEPQWFWGANAPRDCDFFYTNLSGKEPS